MSTEQQKPVSKKQEGNYPVSESLKILEGYDIYRSENLIVALVAVESQFGRDIRMYRWMKRKDQWKVDLCRMSVGRWNWDAISAKVKELKERHDISKRPSGPAEA